MKNKRKLKLCLFFGAIGFLLSSGGLYSHLERQSKNYLDVLLCPGKYKIVEARTGIEGIFGDINRSWVIDVDVDCKWDVNMQSWPMALPHFSSREFETIIRDEFPDFYPTVSRKVDSAQALVPSDKLMSSRTFFARVVPVERHDSPKDPMGSMLLYVSLESN